MKVYASSVSFELPEVLELLSGFNKTISDQQEQLNIQQESISLLTSMLGTRGSSAEWVSINELSKDEFIKKHMEVLKCGHYNFEYPTVSKHDIGVFLAVMYYNNLLNSRSESGTMAEYLNMNGDYMEFYCDFKGTLSNLIQNPTSLRRLVEADIKDRANSCNSAVNS